MRFAAYILKVGFKTKANFKKYANP